MDEKMKQKKLVEIKRLEDCSWKFLGSTQSGWAVFYNSKNDWNGKSEWIYLKFRNIQDKRKQKTLETYWNLLERRPMKDVASAEILKLIPNIWKELNSIMEMAFENVTSEEAERR